ncbi:GNAT family acetyltransferase [Glaciibacter superstes]|uniref:GNAT family acetyltransferase n=1 Tax=Glaciibacter superstes TaxID=501023 RepID=UPI0003B60030|nr:GNAT family acetyltransferase [Glaciibacter superstes]
MQIRDLTSEDSNAAAVLWHQSGLTRPWNSAKDDLQRALDGETSTVLGAFHEEQLLATAMVGHDGHRGWVYYLAVDKGQRGTGLGRRMMAAAEGWLRENGAVKVQLMVRSGNAAAFGFYNHLGYEDADVSVRSKWLT